MKGRPSHRLRFAVGLALAGGLGVGVAHLLLKNEVQQAGVAREERKGVVALQALADLVERAGGRGETVRRAVAAWQGANPSVRLVRVVAFEGVSLEASTAPEDQGDKAAPRRLSRDEKPLYDLGQRLRTAVTTNREEGGARKEEIEISTTHAGALALAAPVAGDGAVLGIVAVETQPLPAPGRPSLLYAFLAWVGPVVLFLLLALLVGERRAWLAAAAVCSLALGFGSYASYSIARVEQERVRSHEAVAEFALAQAGTARAVLSDLGLATTPPLVPSAWDADAFRRPRGFLTESGKLDEARLRANADSASGQALRALILAGVVALGLMLAIGLGGVNRLAATLVANRQAYFYVVPAMIGMIVLVFFPFIYGITLSFTDSNLYNTNKSIAETWVGLRNYGEILGEFSFVKHTDGGFIINYLNFYWTLLYTVVWTVTNVTAGVTVGLLLALILNTKGLAGKPIYRVLLIMPWAMPNYITALIWKGMFHRQYGVVNHVLRLFGGQGVSWFEKPFTSFLTALATNGWLSFPFMMVVSLGALQSIPGEIYEAARVDGASRWQQFRAITLPSLKPALVPAVILSVIWTFNMFNIPYLVTQGEPGSSTEILVTQSYKFAFERYRYGYAAAYSTIIFGILLVYGSIQNRVSKATEAI